MWMLTGIGLVTLVMLTNTKGKKQPVLGFLAVVGLLLMGYSLSVWIWNNMP